MVLRTLLFALLVLVGCGAPSAPPEDLVEQTLEAGCGMCQYGVVGTQGCYWSVEWKGEMLVVQGEVGRLRRIVQHVARAGLLRGPSGVPGKGGRR